MRGYQQDDGSIAGLAGAVYRTGDVATRDADGYLTYVGRADDVFKASDYRISPFELESVLIEHPAVAEAAVVPAPDPMRLAVAKAYVSLVAGAAADRATALSIFRHIRDRLAPFKRVRRLEFANLPKTISGKIRRVELRREEEVRAASEQPDGGRVPRGGFPGAQARRRAGMTACFVLRERMLAAARSCLHRAVMAGLDPAIPIMWHGRAPISGSPGRARR